MQTKLASAAIKHTIFAGAVSNWSERVSAAADWKQLSSPTPSQSREEDGKVQQ